MNLPFDTFASVLAEHFRLGETPCDGDHLSEDLGFDSLMYYECVDLLEELAGHPIADDAIGAIRTVGDLHRVYLQHAHSTPAPLQ